MLYLINIYNGTYSTLIETIINIYWLILGKEEDRSENTEISEDSRAIKVPLKDKPRALKNIPSLQVKNFLRIPSRKNFVKKIPVNNTEDF